MTLGRPREFEIDQALNAAMLYFGKMGYEAASLHGLLKTMGISRSSFYHAFGSKYALFQLCIKHYRDMTHKNMLESLKKSKSGRGFIEHFFVLALTRQRAPTVN